MGFFKSDQSYEVSCHQLIESHYKTQEDKIQKKLKHD